MILGERNVVIEFHEGHIIAEHLIEYKKKQASHKEYSASLNFLVDLRFAKFTGRADKVRKYVDFLANHRNVVGARKVALVADSPDPVVMGTLYQNMQSSLPQDLKIFASIENALRWLDLDMSTASVLRILQELRTKREGKL